MPNLQPTPAETPSPNSAAPSESRSIATLEPKSGTTSFYQQLPQWFLAIFSLAYVSGYLIEFTHFGSFGILDASGEIFKLKYIQTGITFLLLCAIIGVYTIFVLQTTRLNSSIVEALKGGFYLPRSVIFAGAFNVLSIYLAALLTPLPRVETFAQAGGSLFLVILLVLYSFALAYRIEKKFAAQRSAIWGKPAKPRASALRSLVRRSAFLKGMVRFIERRNTGTRPVLYKEQIFASEKSREIALCKLWRRSLCFKNATAAFLLAATLIVDTFVFRTQFAVLRELFLDGGWIFFAFAICMPLLLLRVIDRMKQVTDFGGDGNLAFRHAILQIAGIVLSLLLLFLVLTSYSYGIFPFIPSVKGGGDYENAPTVSAIFKDDGLDKLASELHMGVGGDQRIRDVILIYATTSSFYFAKPEAGNDPCDWRTGGNRPKILELKRDQIVAESFGVEYKNITGTNCR